MLTPDKLAEALKASDLRRGDPDSGTATITLKAAGDTIVSPSPGTSFYDPEVVVPHTRLQVRDLIPEVRISSGVASWYDIAPLTGNFGVVAEDAAKAQGSTQATLHTQTLTTIAGIIKVSDELLDDYSQLAAAIRDEGHRVKEVAVSNQIRFGSGQNGQLTGLLYGSNVPSASWSPMTLPQMWNSFFTSIMDSGYYPDAIVMGKGAYASILMSFANSDSAISGTLTKSPASATDIASATALSAALNVSHLNTQYIYFDGPQLYFLGVPVICASEWGAFNTDVLVGDFANGARIYTQGEKISIGYDDGDFAHDRVTIRISERLTLAIRDKNAFRRKP